MATDLRLLKVSRLNLLQLVFKIPRRFESKILKSSELSYPLEKGIFNMICIIYFNSLPEFIYHTCSYFCHC